MIKNERQYRITKTQADKFGDVLAQLERRVSELSNSDPLVLLHKNAVQSQLADLCAEIEEYEALRSGRRAVLEVESFDDLPRALIQARIAAGLSQKELADRLGLKEQQIQQYEATEYASASFARISEVVDALGIHIREDVFLPAAQVSSAKLFQRMREVYIDRDLILKRLLPRPLAARLEHESGNEGDNAALQAAATIGRVFNLRPVDIFGTKPLHLNTAVAGQTRYKTPANADEHKVNVYTVYAHHLALLTLETTRHLPQKPIPTDYHQVHDAIIDIYGAMTFENALRYVWSLGVPVLPLSDSGRFHGACWRDNGRNVIVIKQGTRYTARWLHDLIHELRHAADKPNEPQFATIETNDLQFGQQDTDEEEIAASFTEDVIFNGRANALAQQCARQAGKSMERLKRVVPQVAAQEKVPADALAYFMAYILDEQGSNWWGAATNLQDKTTDPLRIARSMFGEKVHFNALNKFDRDLLLSALSDIEE